MFCFWFLNCVCDMFRLYFDGCLVACLCFSFGFLVAVLCFFFVCVMFFLLCLCGCSVVFCYGLWGVLLGVFCVVFFVFV